MMLEWDRTNEKSGIILDNKKGITDWDTLNEVERRYSYIRLPELEQIDNNKKIVFNKEYFLSIHKYLFQDIYPWAGTIREVDLFKDNSAFAPARFLDGSLNDFFDNLKRDNFLSGFNTEEVSELASYYMLELNFIHPFREGNGRTKRHFMTQLVKGAGYDLGLDRIRPEELVMADILAFDDNESGIKANPSYFKNVIKTALKPSNEQIIKSTQNESNLDKLNRFLWVYDRFSENAYFRAYNSLSEAEKKLSEQLSTDAGKERIKRYLDRIITKEKAYQDGTAEYRKDIIKSAIQYKNQIDSDQIKKENNSMEKETKMEQEINNEKDLAKKLDLFYSYYDPYGRYDATGSFRPEYDDDNEGLKQTQEALASEKGRKGLDDFLKEVIREDDRPEFIRQAKKLRIELLNPVAQQGSMASYLHQVQTTPQSAKKSEVKSKKQKEIK